MTKKKIILEIEHKDHHTVILTNEKGDTFTYDPQTRNGEELEDFLRGAETNSAAIRKAFEAYLQKMIDSQDNVLIKNDIQNVCGKDIDEFLKDYGKENT